MGIYRLGIMTSIWNGMLLVDKNNRKMDIICLIVWFILIITGFICLYILPEAYPPKIYYMLVDGIPFLFFLVVLYLSKMVSLSSMMAALISSLYITYRQFDSSIEIIIASWLLTILVIYRHRSNIKKIADGTENKISWL